MDRLTAGACEIGLPATVCAIERSIGVAPPDPPMLQPNEIASLLAEQGGCRRAVDAPFKVTGPLGSSSFSRVFRGDGGMFPGPVAIKQFLWDASGASPAESARTYFLGLQKMAEITTRSALRAAEPYALLESHGIVVASWIEALNINGNVRDVQADPDMPLLWVIRDELELTGKNSAAAPDFVVPAPCISRAIRSARARPRYPRSAPGIVS